MRWYKKTSTEKLENWKKEFGPDYDVPKEISDLVAEGLADDLSNGIDLSPSFGKEKTDEEGNIRQVSIWVNHPNPNKREDLSEYRFVVVDEDHVVLANTDDVNQAIKVYLDSAKELIDLKQTLSLESIQERMYDLTRKPTGMTPEEVEEMKSLRQRHKELHPQKKELPRFLAESKKSVKTAEWGHGDTLDGQLMKRELEGISKDLKKLRFAAETNHLDVVLPRWRGEIRHKILLLPPLERIARMSMSELSEVREKIDKIKAAMKRYNQNIFMEIMAD
jgi:hypothetical protein